MDGIYEDQWAERRRAQEDFERGVGLDMKGGRFYLKEYANLRQRAANKLALGESPEAIAASASAEEAADKPAIVDSMPLIPG